MILRIWRTGVERSGWAEYARFEREQSLPMFRQQPGCRGVLFVRTADGSGAAACSLWEDRSAVDRLASSVTYRATVARLLATGLLQGTQSVEVFEVAAGTLDAPTSMEEHGSDVVAVIERFNQAFVQHDGSQLVDLVAADCVMESVEPAPDGTRYEGRSACLRFWQNLANDRNGSFTPEDVVVCADRAIIRWRYRFGVGQAQYVRGVNLMRVRDGVIVEALGYVKSGEPAVSTAVQNATRG